MGKRRVWQAAEIDHVGAGGAILSGAPQDVIEREGRRVDDLREDAYVVAGEIARLALAAEEFREVVDVVGTAHHRHAVVGADGVEVDAAATREDDAIGLDRPW